MVKTATAACRYTGCWQEPVASSLGLQLLSVSELPLHASPPRWTVSRENINKSGKAPNMLTAYNQGRFLIPANILFDHEQG